MVRLLVILLVALLVRSAAAQDDGQDPEAFREQLKDAMAAGMHKSVSGQFIVHRGPKTGWLPNLAPDTNRPVVRLDPDLLVISCERIKKAVLHELAFSRDDWRGKIHINLFPARSLDDEILVTSTWSGSGWIYSVRMPDALEESRFAASVTELVLLEMANRNSQGRCAEVPAWLTQGLAQQMSVTTRAELKQQLVLHPPLTTERGVTLTRLNKSERRTNPMQLAHDEMLQRATLTIEQLSWPEAGAINDPSGDAFRCNAQCLLNELLKLQNGKSCMRNFVTQMSSHLNWQLSFLEAFKSDFETQRDFEKWWSLRVVDFTGRDMSRLWSSGDSWQQVADILTATVEVRDLSGKGPSVETEVNLQTVIRESEYQRQSTILRAKLKELLVLRTSVSPELVPLVDGYFETLQKYMHRREVSSSGRMAGGYVMPSLDYVTRETLRKLDELDLQFKQLDPKPEIQPDAASQSVDTAVRH